MSRNLLETFRSSGDANIGVTLLRLARLAEATHHARAAQLSLNRVEGIDPQAATAPANTDVRGAASPTEVFQTSGIAILPAAEVTR